MINAMATSNPTQRIYPQRIYPPDPPIKTKRINYDPVLGLCNSTQRNLSARSSIKTRRINYDPVLKLYYYKSIRDPDPRTKKRKAKNNFAGIYGGTGGSKPLTRILINLLSRLCGILWACPQAQSPEITGAGTGGPNP